MVKILKKKFISSPIGIIPQNGYSGDRHSKECLAWLYSLEQKWKNENKAINIQHARSPKGEKIVTWIGKNKSTRYKLVVNVNIMGVIGMDVQIVTAEIEKLL